ncbi:MAG TPA: 2Fe-2S iron-sulfur cluster-binding protein [Rhizobiaceae bacterium]|nr:2Fe-2S iron-sulfur cluster-binding protein [Rhizobiaceae bacterium]
MTKITFVTADCRAIEVTGRSGASLMETAVANGVPGIEAECGGACSCATCHVYVDEAWIDTVGRAESMEADMLEMAYDVGENSRLSCQITVSEALDGLLVRLPARQV